MIRRMRKSYFWLFVVAMSFTLSGCGGGSDGSSGSGGNEGASAIVTVTDYSGIRMPNVTVVLGDSNGAMKANGVTDADGQITFDHAPSDATVTAATTCLQSGSTTTTYSLDVQFDVNGSTVLSLNSCAAASSITLPPVSDSPLGTLTVNVINTPIGVTRNQMTVGHQTFSRYVGLMTRQTITIRESDLDNNGTFSIVVQGKDVNNITVAYGILTDQTFTDGMTVDISMNPMSVVQYQISNIPVAAVTLRPSLSIYSSNQGFWSEPSYYLLSAPSSTALAVPYIPGLGDEVRYGIDAELDQDHDGIADSLQSLNFSLSGSAPSDQSFDLSKALSAPYVNVVGADTATPTLSWSGVDPSATSIYLSVSLRSSTRYWYFSLSNLTRSRTSIKYPELPESLAVFRPDKVDYFAIYTSANEGSLSKSSSGSYQAPY